MTKIAVRNGQLVVPTCPNCECRLEKHNTDYFHFTKWAWWIDKDARGCECPLLKTWFMVINGKVTPIWA